MQKLGFVTRPILSNKRNPHATANWKKLEVTQFQIPIKNYTKNYKIQNDGGKETQS